MDQFENNVEQIKKQPMPPHRLSKRAIIVSIAIFGFIVAGMFTFALLKKAEIEEQSTAVGSEEPAAEVKYAAITRVDAKHYFIDGVHTLVGEIPMPTPCDLLEADSVVRESFPEQITIDFTIINNAHFCTEVITPQRFKVSAPASKNATFSATFMARAIELNLIPAESGETPDSFELFLKG